MAACGGASPATSYDSLWVPSSEDDTASRNVVGKRRRHPYIEGSCQVSTVNILTQWGRCAELEKLWDVVLTSFRLVAGNVRIEPVGDSPPSKAASYPQARFGVEVLCRNGRGGGRVSTASDLAGAAPCPLQGKGQVPSASKRGATMWRSFSLWLVFDFEDW